MADDQDSTEAPTRKLGAVAERLSEPSEGRVESIGEEEADSFPTLQVEAVQGKESKSTPPADQSDKMPDVDPDDTEMLDRQKILDNVALDRDALNRRQQTRPARSEKSTPVSGSGPTLKESPSETLKMKVPDQTTREVRGLSEALVEDSDTSGETVRFPARIDDSNSLPIPTVIARNKGFKPGDLVVVVLRKIDD